MQNADTKMFAANGVRVPMRLERIVCILNSEF